ncbi:hypothetical protein MCAP1_003374 [Malassezia caprae]|uniref:Uncharacterized protein n=1 Tax=Malassezia caprae TaxID=1381934 RepID=A0AAF0E7C1_9BASI|nr:hypothetical protein MCAP1_003374 [Malassezia caprae]
MNDESDAVRDAQDTWEEDVDDFGDFEGGEEPAPAAEAEALASQAPSEPSVGALPLSDDPEDAALKEGVRALLPPDFFDIHAPGEGTLPNIAVEGMRLVEGPSQILVSEQIRALYRALQVDNVPSAPLDWRRSYTRRQALIALGVPINLDEVSQEVLPPLELHIPTPAQPAAGTGTLSTPPPRADTQRPETWGERRRRELNMVEPVVPMHRIDALRQMSEEDIKLKTQPELRELLREMEGISTQLGEALQYYLTLRDAFTSDGEVYNGMIRDLVAGASHKHAARAKTEKRSGLMRRGSLRDSGSRPGTPQAK